MIPNLLIGLKMDNQKYYKPKTRSQLAEEYGIDRKTLYNRLKELQLPTNNRRLLMSDCLKIIYKKYGYPKPRQ